MVNQEMNRDTLALLVLEEVNFFMKILSLMVMHLHKSLFLELSFLQGVSIIEVQVKA